jgi:hypothetical protein
VIGNAVLEKAGLMPGFFILTLLSRRFTVPRSQKEERHGGYG